MDEQTAVGLTEHKITSSLCVRYAFHSFTDCLLGIVVSVACKYWHVRPVIMRHHSLMSPINCANRSTNYHCLCSWATGYNGHLFISAQEIILIIGSHDITRVPSESLKVPVIDYD